MAIAVNVYLFVLLGVLYGQAIHSDDLPPGCCMFGSTLRGNFSMISAMFQAVVIQMCVLPMYEELEDRSPQKFDKIVAVGFGILFFLFCGFSIVGYLLIGPEVQSNILKDLPHNIGSSIAQVGTMLVVSCVYPIMVYPMIAPILAGQGRILGVSRRIVAVVAKVVVVIAVMFTALFVEQLGLVNIINGAMSAGIFVALVPSVIGLALLESGTCTKVGLLLLLIVGITVSAMGLVFSDNYVSDLRCLLSA